MFRTLQILLVSMGAALTPFSTVDAKIIGCFIAFEAKGKCEAPAFCRAGHNKVWFEDSDGMRGVAPKWISTPSKVEVDIFLEARNKFVSAASEGNPETFAAKFAERVAFEASVGKTTKFNFFYRCEAQAE